MEQQEEKQPTFNYKIVRKEIHGQMVDVKVYDPVPAPTHINEVNYTLDSILTTSLNDVWQ